MRCRKRCPKRSIDWRMRGTSAMSMPVPTIMIGIAVGPHLTALDLTALDLACEKAMRRFDQAQSQSFHLDRQRPCANPAALVPVRRGQRWAARMLESE